MSGGALQLVSRRQVLATIVATGGLAFAQGAAAKRPPITAAAFAPSMGGQPNEVLIGSQAGIEALSYPDLKPLRRLSTKMSNVHDLKFAGDNLLVAVGGYPAEGGVLELFDWPAGDRQFSRQLHDDVIYAVDVGDSGGGHCVTAGGDGVAKVFDLAARQVVATFAGHSRPILAAALLPGGEFVITAGIDESLRLWDIRTGGQQRSLHNHRAAVRALALRPSGAAAGKATTDLPMIASGGADRTVRFWQPTIGRMMRFVELPSNPLAMAWTFDGDRLLATCEDGALRVLDPETASITATRPTLDGWAHTLCAHPSAFTALVGGPNHQLIRVELSM